MLTLHERALEHRVAPAPHAEAAHEEWLRAEQVRAALRMLRVLRRLEAEGVAPVPAAAEVSIDSVNASKRKRAKLKLGDAEARAARRLRARLGMRAGECPSLDELRARLCD
jgi:hypothetical protein